MDMNEIKLREEIDFWQDFIDKWKAFRNEPVHRIAMESLAQAEKKLHCYLLTRDIERTRKGKDQMGDEFL